MTNKKRLGPLSIFTFRGYPQGVFITNKYLITWKLTLQSTWEQHACNKQNLSLFKISHGCKMMQLQYIESSRATLLSKHLYKCTLACMSCMYIKHIHIDSTMYIYRSRYTYTSLHMSHLCKIPKGLITQMFDVFFPCF